MTFRCLLRNFGSGYLAKDMVSGPRGPGRQTARMRGVEFLRLDLEEDPCTKSSEGDDRSKLLGCEGTEEVAQQAILRWNRVVNVFPG